MATRPAHPMSTFHHHLRAAALGALLAIALIGAALVSARTLARHAATVTARPRLTVDDAVPVVALAVLAAGCLWLAIVVIASIRDLLGRPSPSRAGTGSIMPFAAARVAALLLALTAVGSLTAGPSAIAQPPGVSRITDAPAERLGPRLPVPDFADATSDRDRSGQRCAVPEPGWTSRGPGLQRPASTDQAGLIGRCRLSGGAGEVVVHRGDSLWTIAERELGADARPSEVAARWPAWYLANRSAIGPDPDRLLPGTVLHRPAQEVRQ